MQCGDFKTAAGKRPEIDCIGCDKIREEHPTMKGYCQHCGDVLIELYKATAPLGGLHNES